MRRFVTSIGLALLALTLSAPVAMAQVSTSFQLQESMGDNATGDPGVSTSFQHINNGVTWNDSVLTGNNFILTTGPATTAGTSSSSSSGAGGTTGGGSTGGDTGTSGGGYRPHPAASSASASMSSSSTSSRGPRVPHTYPTTSSASSASAEETTTDLSSSAWTETTYDTSSIDGTALSLRYFGAVDPLCPPAVTLHSAATETATWFWLWIVLFCIAIACSSAMTYVLHKRIRTFLKKKRNRTVAMSVLLALFSLGLGLLLLGMPFTAHAANATTPLLSTYKGNLLNASGTPITTAVTIRFSYWKSSDFVTSDLTGGGAINTSATNYVSWNEVQTVTPTAQGYFSVELGKVTPLIDFSTLPVDTLKNLHLQVEVKMAGDPDTSYELLDTNPSDAALDRSRVTTVPFAHNAELLDQHDTGTGSFNIPVLDLSGLLPKSTIPGGTNANTFVLNSDDSAATEVVLQFGNALSKQLSYDSVNGWFNFNDDVRIQGDLTVTGLVNGINLSSLQSSTGALKAYVGAGLTIMVSGGSYRLNGVVTNYAGASGVAVPASTSSSVFFGSGGLTVTTLGYPTDESYIPVAEVTTNGSSVLTITDRRILNSDDRETTVQTVFNPEFEHASYQGDGTDNIGQLQVSHDNTTKANFYDWSSTRPVLQDYDILLKAHLSPNFVRWKAGGAENPLSLDYRTTNASNAANKVDIQVYDTNGVPVTLSGSVSNLANTSWTTSGIDLGSGGTWTPGQDFLIRIRASAKDNFQVHIGSLKMQYVELRRE